MMHQKQKGILHAISVRLQIYREHVRFELRPKTS